MNKQNYEIQVSIQGNENEYTIQYKQCQTLKDFYNLIEKKLNCQPSRAFDLDGIEIFDIDTLRLLNRVTLTEGKHLFLLKTRKITNDQAFNGSQFSRNPSILQISNIVHNNEGDDKIHIQMVILGNISVGKSSITQRYIRNIFPEYHDCTIQDTYKKEDVIDGKEYVVELYDTAGEEDYQPLRSLWLKNKDGIIFVYAINNKLSFKEVMYFVQEMKQIYNYDEMPQFALIGNKCDLESERKVTFKEGIKAAEEIGANIFMECSAKHSQNIDEIFYALIYKISIIKNRLVSVKRIKQAEQNSINKQEQFCSQCTLI